MLLKPLNARANKFLRLKALADYVNPDLLIRVSRALRYLTDDSDAGLLETHDIVTPEADIDQNPLNQAVLLW